MADPVETVDAYIASFPADVQAGLASLRSVVLEGLPGASESISYGMPTYSIDGRHLMFFAGWKAHLALYAVYSVADDDPALEAELEPLRSGKDTLKLRLDKPLPRELLVRVVAALRAKRLAGA
jgi:uncharacterized protein YdhG (YjbR/CyaY superfamily)